MGRKKPVFEVGEKLRIWAVAGGAENEALTNRYELVRLRVKGGVAIVYRKENGKQTWNPLALQLRQAMETGNPFPAGLRHVPKVGVSRKNDVAHRTLTERDGAGCFFCFEEVADDMTIEHLVPRIHGGPNHISNKFRACSACNIRAGHLSAPEKIRIREVNLLKRAADQKVAA